MEIDQPLRDEMHPNPLPSNYRKIELQSPLDLTYLQDNLAKVALEKLNFVLPDHPRQSKPATVISLGGGGGGNKQTQTATKAGTEDPAEEQQQEDDDDDTERDPLKEQVRNLVSEFLQSTWQNAQQSISLNGLDASDITVPHTATLSKPPAPRTKMDNKKSSPQDQRHQQQEEEKEREEDREREGVHFTYSPFDPRLQHQLASLHGELDKLTAEVSRLRREAPQNSATMYASSLDRCMQIDEDDFRQTTSHHHHHDNNNNQSGSNTNNRRNDDDEGDDEDDGLQIDEVRKGWSHDIKEKYNGGVRELASLAGVIPSSNNSQGKQHPSLTETMGKAIRARDVVHEME